MSLFLSVAALAAAQGAYASDPKEVSKIVVEGTGSVKNPPNVANLSYDVQGEGQTSDQAVGALVAKSAAIENALRSMDPSLVLHNATVRIQAVRGDDCKEEEYSDSLHLSKGACAIVGFVATQDFDAKTSLVSDAGTMVGLAGRQGATDPKIDSFGLADQREAKRAAIADALADARIKADAVAAGSNTKVSDLLLVTLDGARGGEEIVVTGMKRVSGNAAPTPISVKVAPAPVTTTANVTVTYAIAR
jgi:uncharacterized protein YggE